MDGGQLMSHSNLPERFQYQQNCFDVTTLESGTAQGSLKWQQPAEKGIIEPNEPTLCYRTSSMTLLTEQQPNHTRTKQKARGQSIPKIPAPPEQCRHKSPCQHWHRAKIHFLLGERKKEDTAASTGTQNWHSDLSDPQGQWEDFSKYLEHKHHGSMDWRLSYWKEFTQAFMSASCNIVQNRAQAKFLTGTLCCLYWVHLKLQ